MEDDRITPDTPKTLVKDPKRVAAGKRLGAISKAAKEKKARESYDRERELVEADRTLPIVVVAVGIGLIGLCYVCCERGPTEPSPKPSPEEEAVPQEIRSVRERRSLESFD